MTAAAFLPARQGLPLRKRGVDLPKLIAFAQAQRAAGKNCPQIAAAIRKAFRLEISGATADKLASGTYATKPVVQSGKAKENIAVQLAKLDAEVAKQTRESNAAAERLGWHCQAGCFQRNYGPTCTRCGRPR